MLEKKKLENMTVKELRAFVKGKSIFKGSSRMTKKADLIDFMLSREKGKTKSTRKKLYDTPSKLEQIEKLSHYHAFGDSWIKLDSTTAKMKIKQAAKYQKKTEYQIKKLLASGETIECSHTLMRYTPDLIRDSVIHDKMRREKQLEEERLLKEKKRKYRYYTCKSCGTSGYGGAYPFSTAPSTGYCDDCL